MSQSPFAATSPASAASYEDIDLAHIRNALIKRAPWILTITLFALVGSLIAVNLIAPRYTGEAKVFLEIPDLYYTRPDPNARDNDKTFDAEGVQSQVQLIMSRDLARAAIKKMGLVGNPEFDPVVAEMGPVSRFLVMLGFMKNPVDRAPDDRVLDSYFDSLLVFAVGKSRVVAIEFTSKDPEIAARMANTIAELYLEMQEAAKKDTARSASDWLGSAIKPLQKSVQEAEARVEEYRARQDLLLGPSKDTLTAQQLSELSLKLAAARSDQADAHSKAKLIRDLIKTQRTLEIPDVANNELIRRLAEQRVTLRGQLALESRTLLAEHPRIKELNAQLANLDVEIRKEAEHAVQTLENAAKIAGSKVESISAELEGQKKVAAGANADEVELRALERDAKNKREQLESYLVKYREAVARDAANAVPADARVVSRAIAPTVPAFPKKMPIVLLTTLAVFVLACALVVTRELLSGRAMSYSATPAMTAAEAVPPSVGLGPRRRETEGDEEPEAPLLDLAAPTTASFPEFVAVGTGASLANAYGKLAAELPPARTDGRGRRILVTEIEGGQGLLATARGLARHLARNERVILVSVADDAISPSRLGLTDLVAAKASFAEIIERETGSRLHIMAPGTQDAKILTQTTDMLELALAALDQTYDWVFLMVPGDRRGEFVPLLASRTDGTILAARVADGEGSGAATSYETLRAAGARHIVVALQGSESAAAA